MPALDSETERLWPVVQKVLFVPNTEEEYQQLLAVLDMIMDVVGEAESHPLAPLMQVIGILIEKYEEKSVSENSDV